MLINLREITYSDSKLLLEWHNDQGTRKFSFDHSEVDLSSHTKYINNIIEDTERTQYLLEVNGVPVGTIKDKLLEDCTELSYTVSPYHRGMKISILLMTCYLHNRNGKFLCKINERNIPSIRMVERCGYKLDNVINGVCHYSLSR